MREISGSIPGRAEHKNLCERRELSDNVSFPRAVKRQRFDNFKHMIQSQEKKKNILYKHFTQWNWISVRSQQLSLIYSRITNSKVTYDPLYDMIKILNRVNGGKT